MREEPTPYLETEEDAAAFYEGVGMADTSNTYEAIEDFDRLLKPHGLEVLLYTGSSDYVFRIVPRSGQ